MRLLPVAVFGLAGLTCARAQFLQQGPKLIGNDARLSGTGVSQGSAIAVSADGSTMLVGGWDDNGYVGAAWVYTKSNGSWAQQGPKLVGTGAVIGTIGGNQQAAQQGSAVALSADGSTAAVGGYTDNGGVGAVWIFTRSNGVWTQQGNKLTGSDAVMSSNGLIFQGISVALSSDGNTLLVGGWGDNNPVGAAWVYTRSNGAWTQQGPKLVGTTNGTPASADQGLSVALSGDGNTAIVGGPADTGYVGAAWVFTRSGGKWTQQGAKLTGNGAVGNSATGWSVAISGDGNTALLGGLQDNTNVGAVWVFSRSNGTWTQQGPKLVGTGLTGNQYQGVAVSLSNSGNLALVGGAAPFQFPNVGGAAWVFKRNGATWAQSGSLLAPSDANGSVSNFGYSVALSADGTTAAIGGPNDNTTSGAPMGAAWAFYQAAATHFLLTAPGAAAPGAPFSITVVAFDANNNVATGYAGTVHFTSTDPAAVLPADTALNGGTGTFAATLNTAGNRTIGATDTANSTVTGTTGGIAVAGTQPIGVGPGSGSGLGQTMIFTFSDPRGYQDLDVVNVLINNFLDGRQACYLAYSRSLNVLYLVNDTGTALLPGMVLTGQPGSLANSQCTINGTGSFATGSGTQLTLTLNMNFPAAFAGNRVIYLAARDLHGGNSGWQALGTWNIPGAVTFPAVLGVVPARGAGSQQTSFTFTFSDTKGFQDLGVLNVLINNFLDGRQACYLAYLRPTGQLFLEKDDGSGLLPAATLGSTGTLANSQCSIALASSSATVSGNILTLTLNIGFTGAFAGNRIIYAAARDSTDANNSGWQAIGSWTVQ